MPTPTPAVSSNQNLKDDNKKATGKNGHTKEQLRFLMRPMHPLRIRVVAHRMLHGKKSRLLLHEIADDLNEQTEQYFRDAGVELTEPARQGGKVTPEKLSRALARGGRA